MQINSICRNSKNMYKQKIIFKTCKENCETNFCIRPKKITEFPVTCQKKLGKEGGRFFMFFLFVYLNMILEYICLFYISKLMI